MLLVVIVTILVPLSYENFSKYGILKSGYKNLENTVSNLTDLSLFNLV